MKKPNKKSYRFVLMKCPRGGCNSHGIERCPELFTNKVLDLTAICMCECHESGERAVKITRSTADHNDTTDDGDTSRVPFSDRT